MASAPAPGNTGVVTRCAPALSIHLTISACQLRTTVDGAITTARHGRRPSTSVRRRLGWAALLTAQRLPVDYPSIARFLVAGTGGAPVSLSFVCKHVCSRPRRGGSGGIWGGSGGILGLEVGSGAILAFPGFGAGVDSALAPAMHPRNIPRIRSLDMHSL